MAKTEFLFTATRLSASTASPTRKKTTKRPRPKSHIEIFRIGPPLGLQEQLSKNGNRTFSIQGVIHVCMLSA